MTSFVSWRTSYPLTVMNFYWLINLVHAFSLVSHSLVPSWNQIQLFKPTKKLMAINNKDDPLDYDDDDFWGEDNEDTMLFAQLNQDKQKDLSGCSVRQFNLGYDVILTDFAGSLGFEEVTDWEYYMPSLVNNERKVVDPPPFDPNLPKRTKEKSGSVVRIFRGELSGRLGSMARARGLDKRIMLKEFSGKRALDLAKAELLSLSEMQSSIVSEINEGARNGDWLSSASTRYIMGRVNKSTKEDDENLLNWMDYLCHKGTPFVGVLGELNLEEFLNDEEGNVRNEWYKALKVLPPEKSSLFLVYEYVGLSTFRSYSQPGLKKLSNLPVQRNIWGQVSPPTLPPWKERAKYVMAMMKQSIEKLSQVHECGIAHRSIGPNSIIITSIGQDKQEASSPLATVAQRMKIKLSDFGFSEKLINLSCDEDFRRRARAFKLNIIESSSILESKSFAIAEDLHALGFVFMALMLSSLAEIPIPTYSIPPTDEDSLKRLMLDIFDKDMNEFREYCEAEEVWGKLVQLLDEKEGAGWNLLDQMIFARESAVNNLAMGKMLSAEGLLSSPFFKIK